MLDGLREINGIGEIEVALLFAAVFAVVFGLLARRLETPFPIVMLIGGLVLALFPASVTST